jgi:hypothetical protein
MSRLTPWLITIAFLAAFFALGTSLDGPHELDVAQATADTVTALPEQHAAMQVTR